ncbi:N-terminal Xaa-Pro-Lys N-methyltransferase 1 [Desmophyllum pertusum]|uniref:Alpha N-terminal protein methyltransferase 1 n=1 Tax=Desmophyllum pertusum TaxID=174260 RepID=A0A9X0D7D0_9CNID|nr:N-terminal Xaa-Pro-Lys N-methyltransferase 1 [Desmophyllum pertusum]
MASTDESDALTEMQDKGRWYGDAADYWKLPDECIETKPAKVRRIEPTNDTSSIERIKPAIALDCGAGIGRVTKNLLLPLFDTVDMVEQNPDFLEKAKVYLGEKKDRIGNFYPQGLQDFKPEAGRYSVIWCQWVLGHLTDNDFVDFFERCQSGLSAGGLICVKENVTKTGMDMDSEDSSVTRSDEKLRELFTKSSLTVIKDEVQKNFPGELTELKCMR